MAQVTRIVAAIDDKCRAQNFEMPAAFNLNLHREYCAQLAAGRGSGSINVEEPPHSF